MSVDSLLNKIVILKSPMYVYLHKEFQRTGQAGKPTLLPKGLAILVKHYSKKFKGWRVFIYKKQYWVVQASYINNCAGTILPNTKVGRTLYLTET